MLTNCVHLRHSFTPPLYAGDKGTVILQCSSESDTCAGCSQSSFDAARVKRFAPFIKGDFYVPATQRDKATLQAIRKLTHGKKRKAVRL